MKNHIRQSLFINNLLHLITQIAVSNWKTNSIIPWGFFIQLVLFLNYRNAPYIIYMVLLDKFLQITTNFFTRNEKTILHRFPTPHNIVLLYLYFHCLCQWCKQRRHLRIPQHFHQQLCIHSIRHRNCKVLCKMIIKLFVSKTNWTLPMNIHSCHIRFSISLNHT